MDFGQRRRIDTGTAFNPDLRARSMSGQPVRNRRKPRHAGLLEAVHRLDVALDPAAREELARWIRSEYETELGDVPVGFVAECFLGPPYVDHRLDLFQSIVDHFAPADVMPEPFAQARMLVRTGAYAYVEVYASGELHPVRSDGTVVAP